MEGALGGYSALFCKAVKVHILIGVFSFNGCNYCQWRRLNYWFGFRQYLRVVRWLTRV
jgi:hypothetical protein